MSLLTLATTAQFALPNPGPGTLPGKIDPQSSYVIGLMITIGGIVGIVCLIGAFLFMMVGFGGHGGNGISGIGKVLGAVVGVLSSAAIVGGIFAVV